MAWTQEKRAEWGRAQATPEHIAKMNEARERLKRERVEAIFHVRRLVNTGRGGEALTWVLSEAPTNRAVGEMKLWQLQEALTGATYRMAVTTLRRMMRWLGLPEEKMGTLTIYWLLDGRSDGRRLSAWVMSLAWSNGFRPEPVRPWRSLNELA